MNHKISVKKSLKTYRFEALMIISG